MNIHFDRKLRYLHVSAEEWELYTSSYPGGCQVAADEINEAIVEAFNKEDATLSSVMNASLSVMRKHSNLGAMDSEPMWRLERLLAKLFPAEKAFSA